ncbi:MAG: hypothetical protein H7Z41_08400 [Cytophagales bacterium]|nr:hypothetical protein [Armatimonadota bacterium]
MLRNTRLSAALLAAGVAAGFTFAAAKAQTAPPEPTVKATKPLLFMLLPYETKAQLAARTGAAQKNYWGTWAAYGKKLAEAGVLAGGSALQSPSDARTLRTRNGKPQITTGAYSDTKEQITGYLTLRVGSMDEALRWAAECPAVKNGGAVEIRPTVPTMASDRQ